MTEPDQISVLSASVREFAAERNWSQFHDRISEAEAIMDTALRILDADIPEKPELPMEIE